MKRKVVLLLLDAAILFVAMVLCSPKSTGLLIHEIVGLLFVLPLFMHLVLSRKSIVSKIRSFELQKNIPRKIGFLLNMFLFVLCLSELVSGLFISQFVRSWLGLSLFIDSRWRTIHNQSSFGIVVLLGLHIAMRWEIVAGYLKAVVRSNQNSNITFSRQLTVKTLLDIFALLIISVVFSIFLVLVIGLPVRYRNYEGNEINRLAANVYVGSVQLVGSLVAITILILLIRQIIKIRP